MLSRAKAGESVAGNNAAISLGGSDDEGPSKNKAASSGFAALGIEPGDVGMEDEEDFGGLMVSIYYQWVHFLSNDLRNTGCNQSIVR